jgi:hypothetical protein
VQYAMTGLSREFSNTFIAASTAFRGLHFIVTEHTGIVQVNQSTLSLPNGLHDLCNTVETIAGLPMIVVSWMLYVQVLLDSLS